MTLINLISSWTIPFLLILIICFGLAKKVKIYNSFTDGAMEGIKTAVKILPYLIAMLIAINVFKASGAMDLLIKLISNFLYFLNIPEDVIPLLFLRPLSGSASLSYTGQLLQEFGPDSFIGKLASTIQGSSETTFYIVAVYCGALGIKKYRYAVTVGLLADMAGFFAAVFICRLLFS